MNQNSGLTGCRYIGVKSINKEYFSEVFSQSMRYVNKWRKFERILGPIFLVVGIYLSFKSKGQYIVPNVLIVIGVYEIISPILKKQFRIRKQLRSKLANCEIRINLTEVGVEASAPHMQAQ